MKLVTPIALALLCASCVSSHTSSPVYYRVVTAERQGISTKVKVIDTTSHRELCGFIILPTDTLKVGDVFYVNYVKISR